MKVTLFDCTAKGNPRKAANMLLFTKSTRLKMSPGLLDEIEAWSDERALQELSYMANTVPSSWEFVHYSFIIEGVSRAFTHQLVRTRTAGYAQQAMRVVDMSEGRGWEYTTGPSIAVNPAGEELYDDTMNVIDENYKKLIALGVRNEDARGILPTNIHTNICMTLNMRALIELIRKRQSPRVQDEYQHFIHKLREAAIAEHPWLTVFLYREADILVRELYEYLKLIPDEVERTNAVKRLDQLSVNHL